MPDTDDIERKFWKSLRSDMTVMLGTDDGANRVPPRPMTAQIDGDEDRGPIWFFTARETSLGHVNGATRASFAFADRGHTLFANVTGILSQSGDRAVIDRLWNPFVAAWYKDGKDDPTLRLLRFDARDAEIWLDGSSIVAGLKVLFGSDPKKDYADNKATVMLT